MGLRGAPWRVRGDAAERGPWLSTWTRTADGGWVGATIPNLTGELARTKVPTVALEIEPRGDFAVRWIHPATEAGKATPLPPGEAAVFRLVPSGD